MGHRKKLVKPALRKAYAQKLEREFCISERRACGLIGISRKCRRYQSVKAQKDEALKNHLGELATKWKRFGYRRLHVLLLREGYQVNHKRVYRLYKEAGLSLRRKKKRRPFQKRGRPQAAARAANTRWSMDFKSDVTSRGQRFRILTVIDEVTRECLALEVDTSITGARVVSVMNRVAFFRGYPDEVLTDNGSEFAGDAFSQWAYDNKVEQLFIEPGKPMQNGYIESFNGRFREECLNEHWFLNLQEARAIIEEWRTVYNQRRPHSSLGYMTPIEYAQELSKAS